MTNPVKPGSAFVLVKHILPTHVGIWDFPNLAPADAEMQKVHCATDHPGRSLGGGQRKIIGKHCDLEGNFGRD